MAGRFRWHWVGITPWIGACEQARRCLFTPCEAKNAGIVGSLFFSSHVVCIEQLQPPQIPQLLLYLYTYMPLFVYLMVNMPSQVRFMVVTCCTSEERNFPDRSEQEKCVEYMRSLKLRRVRLLRGSQHHMERPSPRFDAQRRPSSIRTLWMACWGPGCGALPACPPPHEKQPPRNICVNAKTVFT